MKVTDTVYEESKGGRTSLRLKVDGTLVILTDDVKPSLFQSGIVFIGLGNDRFENELPSIKFNDISLEGFTTDPEIVHWQNQFCLDLRFGRFKPGPVKKGILNASELKEVMDKIFEEGAEN